MVILTYLRCYGHKIHLNVIKILFADWSIKIFIVTYRKGPKTIIIQPYMGFMDMKNSTDTLRNMFDVTKILFADWSMKLFIMKHGIDHKTLSI